MTNHYFFLLTLQLCCCQGKPNGNGSTHTWTTTMSIYLSNTEMKVKIEDFKLLCKSTTENGNKYKNSSRQTLN